MNLELAHELEEAIDIYNDGVDEDERIYWWDVLNEMSDLTDDAEVMRVIEMIKAEAGKNEQKKRLEEALEKYNNTAEVKFGMATVEQMIGDISNRIRVESAIRAIEKMAKENE